MPVKPEVRMSWKVETKVKQRFDPKTGAPDPHFSVILKDGDDAVAIVIEPRAHYSSPAEERAEAAAKRGRFIAAVLNSHSPYIEASEDALDQDALTEALESACEGEFKTLREFLGFLELKYAATVERYAEMLDDGEGDLLRKEGA